MNKHIVQGNALHIRPTDTYDEAPKVNVRAKDKDGDSIWIEYRGTRTWASVVVFQPSDAAAAAVSLNKRGMIKARDAMNAAIDAMSDDGVDCDAEED